MTKNNKLKYKSKQKLDKISHNFSVNWANLKLAKAADCELLMGTSTRNKVRKAPAPEPKWFTGEKREEKNVKKKKIKRGILLEAKVAD